MKTNLVVSVVMFVVMAMVPMASQAASPEEALTAEEMAAVNESVPVEESSAVTFQSGVVSKYVDENGSVLLSKPAVQSELIISIGKGFYGYVWNSIGIGDSKVDEINFGLGWEGEFAGFKIDSGVLYVDLVGLGKFEKTDLWEPYVKVSKAFSLDEAEKNTLIPYVLTEYFITNGTKEFNGGLYLHGGIEYVWNGKDVLLKQKLDVLYDDGVFGFEKSVVGSYEGRVDVAIAKCFGIYGGVRLVTPITHVSDGRKFEAIPTGGITVKF